MELGHYHLFNMSFYYLPVKPTLQNRRLMAWGQLNITCWTTAEPMTHVGRPLTHLTSFHFNLDPRALLRMTTGNEIGVMCRFEVKSPKTSTNCKQVFKRVTFKSCFIDRSL